MKKDTRKEKRILLINKKSFAIWILIIILLLLGLFDVLNVPRHKTSNSTSQPIVSPKTTSEVLGTVQTYMCETSIPTMVKDEEIITTQTTTTNVTVKTTAYTTIAEVNDQETWIYFNCSAYCSCVKCTGSGKGITASGNITKPNWTIAASKKYPFGTLIYIEGYGTYCVEDRGGAINDNKLDIYFASHSEACEFGRKQLRGYVVRWGYGN